MPNTPEKQNPQRKKEAYPILTMDRRQSPSTYISNVDTLGVPRNLKISFLPHALGIGIQNWIVAMKDLGQRDSIRISCC